MHWFRSISVLALATVGFCGVAHASGEVVGNVRTVQTYGYGTPPQGTRAPKYPRDGVVTEEFLETVPRGAMVVRFRDETELTLGENARVTVDRFAYDPATRAGQQTVNLSKGAFRFVSGRMSRENIRIETPVASIGVRGTVVTGYHDEATDTSVISVLDGEATVTPRVGGPPIVLTAGQAISINRTTGQVQRIGHAVATGEALVDRAPGVDVAFGQLPMRQSPGRTGEQAYPRLEIRANSSGFSSSSSSSSSFSSPFNNNSSSFFYR